MSTLINSPMKCTKCSRRSRPHSRGQRFLRYILPFWLDAMSLLGRRVPTANISLLTTVRRIGVGSVLVQILLILRVDLIGIGHTFIGLPWRHEPISINFDIQNLHCHFSFQFLGYRHYQSQLQNTPFVVAGQDTNDQSWT
jgi:hypothetical protein